MNTYNFAPLLDGLTFVFVGQNATTGSPHPITGNYSTYGGFIAFKNKADAKRYVSELSLNSYYGEFAACGTYKTLRKYKQGQSVYSYLGSLCFVPCLSYDDQGNLI